MKIGIILYPWGENTPTGLAKAIFELTRWMIKSEDRNEYTIFLKGKKKNPPEFIGDNWHIEYLPDKFFWLDRGLAQNPAMDVYIFNTPLLPLFFKPKRSILIAYDFAYKYFKADSWRDYFKKKLVSLYHHFSLKKADMIIAVSEATKKDIVKFYKIDERKIEVVYLGFEKRENFPEEYMMLPEKFFLFVGDIKERKNVLNIIKAFRIFKRQHEDYCLLLIGKGEGKYFENVKQYIEAADLQEDVLIKGYLNEANLIFLYRRAQALIFPSLIEGFGFPVLEAMSFGLPVITSDCSSLKEIAKNGSALLVDPHSPDDIAQAMGKIISDRELRNRLAINGFEQVKRFSWNKCASEIAGIIQSL